MGWAHGSMAGEDLTLGTGTTEVQGAVAMTGRTITITAGATRYFTGAGSLSLTAGALRVGSGAKVVFGVPVSLTVCRDPLVPLVGLHLGRPQLDWGHFFFFTKMSSATNVVLAA